MLLAKLGGGVACNQLVIGAWVACSWWKSRMERRTEKIDLSIGPQPNDADSRARSNLDFRQRGSRGIANPYT